MRKFLCLFLAIFMVFSVNMLLVSCSSQEKEIKEIEAVISDYKNDLGVLRREQKEWKAEYQRDKSNKEAKEKLEIIEREIRIKEAQLSRWEERLERLLQEVEEKD